jgi:hypothetical protein
MFAVKQLKPSPAPIFIAQLIKLGKWLATPPPVHANDDSGWYTGLCVDPTGFSDQLSKLRNALRPESHSGAPKPRTQGTDN